MEVHDRLSRWRGFGSADVRLLRTLSSHLATAVDNRRLVGRLRHHAYHDPLTGLLNRIGFREVAGDPVSGDIACLARGEPAVQDARPAPRVRAGTRPGGRGDCLDG